MSGSVLTPDLALDYLGELSADITAAVIVDRAGSVAAVTGDDQDRGERMRGLATELLDAATEVSVDDGIDQVEVVTPEGSVFAVRGEAWTIAVVAGRDPLSSLMFYDLRSVLRDLGAGE